MTPFPISALSNINIVGSGADLTVLDAEQTSRVFDFINVTNSLRPLAQRKTYTIGTDDYVESFIKEVKPFHTKIREYRLGYTNLDIQDGINTDFDLPVFYDVNLDTNRGWSGNK